MILMVTWLCSIRLLHGVEDCWAATTIVLVHLIGDRAWRDFRNHHGRRLETEEVEDAGIAQRQAFCVF